MVEDDSETTNDQIIKQKLEQTTSIKEHSVPDEYEEVCIFHGAGLNRLLYFD